MLFALQMTTGNAVISTIGSLTTTYKGTIVVQNEGCNQSATVEFKDGSSWKSLGSKKGIKNGVSYLCNCLCWSILTQHLSIPTSLPRLHGLCHRACVQPECEKASCQQQLALAKWPSLIDAKSVCPADRGLCEEGWALAGQAHIQRHLDGQGGGGHARWLPVDPVPGEPCSRRAQQVSAHDMTQLYVVLCSAVRNGQRVIIQGPKDAVLMRP